MKISQAHELPTRDQVGEIYLGPYIDGKDTYLLKSREIVLVIEGGSHEFWHLDHEGQVLGHWRPRFDCDCEYGLRTEYELRDFTLFQLNGRCNDMRVDDHWHWDVRVLLNVSRRLDPDRPEPRALWAALGKARQP